MLNNNTNNKMSYPTVNFTSKTFAEELTSAFDKYGVCAITNVIPKEDCNNIMDKIVDSFEKLGSGLNRKDPNSWTGYNTPTQTRTGMYQALMPNLPIIWKTKTRSEIVKIFEILYQKFKPNSSKELIVSNDGINIKPGHVGPFNNDNPTPVDWPHIDQTSSDDPFKCIQGQLVLTDTTAAFRCTPQSHKHLKELLEYYNKLGDPGEWFKFSGPEARDIQKWLENDKKLTWQVPVYAPAGSFIVWSSATIHSAKFADKAVTSPIDDPWQGWRGVLYISYRPASDFTSNMNDIYRKKDIIRKNKVTNHWGFKIFDLYASFRHKTEEKHPAIRELNDHPIKLYTKLGIDIEKEVLEDPQVLKYITYEIPDTPTEIPETLTETPQKSNEQNTPKQNTPKQNVKGKKKLVKCN